MEGTKNKTCNGVTIGYWPDPLDPNWMGFVVWSGLALHHLQKNWLLRVWMLGQSQQYSYLSTYTFIMSSKSIATYSSVACLDFLNALEQAFDRKPFQSSFTIVKSRFFNEP